MSIEGFGQEGDAILIAFAVANDDLVEVGINILDAEAAAAMFHPLAGGDKIRAPGFPGD